MAVLIPVEDYQNYFEDPDVEIYTQARTKEFEKQDRLSKALLAKAKEFLGR